MKNQASFAILPTFDAPEDGALLAVVETPKGSRNKYAYNHDLRALELRKVLPRGMIFPFDFGFIPSTKAADGDPLDVLLLLDNSVPMGCIVRIRAIGALEAEQREGGRWTRNMIVQFKASALRQTRDDRGCGRHRWPLRAGHWRPIPRLPGDLSRKRDTNRKACSGAQGESGSVGSAAWQRSCRARRRRSNAGEFRAGGFRPRDLADDRALCRLGSRPLCRCVVLCRRARLAGAQAMALKG